jgi:hypothetical protein
MPCIDQLKGAPMKQFKVQSVDEHCKEASIKNNAKLKDKCFTNDFRIKQEIALAPCCHIYNNICVSNCYNKSYRPTFPMQMSRSLW